MRFGRRRQPEPPEWATSLDAEQFPVFMAALDEAPAPYGYAVDDGVVTVTGRDSRYGLGNLLQQWALSDDPSGLVASHFESMFAAEAEERPEGDALLARLRAQLWDRWRIEHSAEIPLISRPFADGLTAVLCVDGEHSIHNLQPEEAESTGRTVEELWEIGLAQIDDGEPTEVVDAGEGVRALTGDSFFVASRLQDLQRFAGPIGDDGALVAVPHRHMLLWHPFTTLEAVGALNRLMFMTPRICEEGPGSLSEHLYWWRPTGIERIPVVEEDGALVVQITGELTDLLNRLPEA